MLRYHSDPRTNDHSFLCKHVIPCLRLPHVVRLRSRLVKSPIRLFHYHRRSVPPWRLDHLQPRWDSTKNFITEWKRSRLSHGSTRQFSSWWKELREGSKVGGIKRYSSTLAIRSGVNDLDKCDSIGWIAGKNWKASCSTISRRFCW